ncbi:MAG: GNAT family N-acetyltransferase [Deltaproteobacteria bacterium]|nr:GNAT family N-acetyltransferase [Deltaproteobacteria bacterium]
MTENARNKATAKVLAGTLTLMARELEGLTPPLNLWTGTLTAPYIKETALAVSYGESAVLWVNDSYPSQGLMLCRPQQLESDLLGAGSLRLTGPWMVDLEPASRWAKAKSLAAKAKVLAEQSRCRFLSIKTWHDPAVLRGLIDGGFQLAEIIAVFSGPLTPEDAKDKSRLRPAGVSFRKPLSWEFEGWFEAFEELFYDGHLLHGPFLAPDFQMKLWKEVALRELAAGSPFVFLWQDRPEKLLGLAWGSLKGPEASLSAIHVVEGRRGQGLGSYLAGALFKQMSVRGGREIRAETSSWNLPAQALYRSLGLKTRAPLIALHMMLDG